MGYTHPGLFWLLGIPTLAIVAVPVLIHLINMLRHRRVDWAAMEFLLLSQRKHRTWIILKQLLLLLLRMLAVATVVFIVAQPLLRNELGNLFGTSHTHHIVLLDDSFSMSDHWGDTSAFNEGKQVIKRLGAKAAEQVESQTFTLLRFSRAGRIGRDRQPDLLKEGVNRDQFVAKLDDVLSKIQVSQTDAGPLDSLKVIGQLLGEANDERRIVYVVSDFRTRDWNDPTDVREKLLELTSAGVELHLINCVDQARPNLAIAALAPQEGIQAAGVTFKMEVTVHNFGTAPAKDVAVSLEEDGNSRPGVTIARIDPGRAVTAPFEVHFPTAGEHQVTARLESDAVAVDNLRYAVVTLPAELPMLLIDGDPDALDARYLAMTLAPGGAVKTGLRPQIETPRFLGIKSPGEFAAMSLLNVERLDKSAIDAVERFVNDGGGAAVFLGEHSQAKLINEQWYRDGRGFFPLPLRGPAELLVDRLERAPDISPAEDHFIFRVFAGDLKSLASTVVIQRYMAAADGWQPPPDSGAKVIARLRTGVPLVVERPFGKGRVVVFLTTAAPVWNNWARNPSFVAAMLDLQAYLARRPAGDASRQVGTPLEVRFPTADYKQDVRFKVPGEAVPTATVSATPAAGGAAVVAFPDTDRSGVYEALLTKNDAEGTAEVRRFACNVDADEGNLEAMAGPELANRLEGVKYQYEQAAAFQYAASEMAGYNLGQALLYGLVALLIVEQLLAWSASYHPPVRQAAMAKGGAA